jgi:hypothetical protein
MIKLNIEQLLKEKGKTRYWLGRQLGMGYGNLTKMVNNETKMIKLENIEALCQILECTPNELFTITDD